MEQWYDVKEGLPNGDEWVKVLYRSGWEATGQANGFIWSHSADDPIERYCRIRGPVPYKQVFRRSN